MAHKPGSRKGQVHEVFDAQGADAATTLALKLGLAAGTVRSWLNTWAKGSGVKLPKPVREPRPEGAPAPTRRRRISVDPNARRVYDIGAPDVHGVVVEAGPQVSHVRWDVDKPWGPERYVSNKYLRTVGEPPPKSKKKAKVETGE